MTNPTNPAWLGQVRVLPTTNEIQAAERVLKTAETAEQQEAAETALLGVVLSYLADEACVTDAFRQAYSTLAENPQQNEMRLAKQKTAQWLASHGSLRCRR